jgi:hypothetical protein
MPFAGPDPSLASLSAGLYDAAKNAGLTPDELKVANGLGAAYEVGRKLRALDPTTAAKQFATYSPEAQAQLKHLFPNDKYVQTPKSFGQEMLGAATFLPRTIWAVAKSPFIETFKALNAVSRGIATPVSLVEQANVNKVPVLFSGKQWSDAYHSRNQWVNTEIAKLEQKYGKATVFVAQANHDALSPTQILDRWGSADPAILGAISRSLDIKDEGYKQILQEVKQSSLNIGDLQNIFLSNTLATHPMKSGSFIDRFVNWTANQMTGSKDWQRDPKAIKALQDLTNNARNASSGLTNAIFDIALDPTTYLTGGTGQALTKGEKIVAAATRDFENNVPAAEVVNKLFAENPGVPNFWNTRMGPLVEQFAKGNDIAKADAVAAVRSVAPAYDNVDQIKLLAEHKVFDAESAQNFFGQIKNTPLLFAGAVDNINFFRNGVATARDSRFFDSGRTAFLKSMFGTEVGASPVYKTVDEFAKKGNDFFTALKTAGQELEQGVNPNLPQLDDLYKDVSKTKQLGYKIGQILERNPGGKQILVGDDAVKTAENFRLITRLAGFDKGMSYFHMVRFLESSPDEQVVILRNLYYMIMQRAGLEGSAGGRQIMEEVLNKTFNDKYGFGSSVRTIIDKDFANVTGGHAITFENDVPVLKTRGAIHPSQLAEGIASIPMEDLLNAAAMSRAAKYNPALLEGGLQEAIKNVSWRTPLDVTDGITRSAFVRKMTDVWSFFTIASRLGFRSAIDEMFFYLMTAPTKDLISFATGGGRAAGNVATAYTGSEGAVGPVEKYFNKIFRKGGPEGSLDGAARRQIVVDLHDKLQKELGYDIPIETIRHMQIREETARRAFGLYGNDMDAIDAKNLKQLLVTNPNFFDATASSVAARTSVSGQIDRDFVDSMFPISALTSALEEVGVKSGRKFNVLDTAAQKRLGEKYVSLAHYDNFWIRFVHNEQALGEGFYINPVPAFFVNKGLETPKDFERAVYMLKNNIGLKLDTSLDQNGFALDKWVFKNEGGEAAVRKFNNLFGNSVLERQKGRTEEEIADIHIKTMLHDMKNTFHGNGKAFNQELYDTVVNKWRELSDAETATGKPIPDKWEKATASIEFQDFEKLTTGKHPEGDINTRLELPYMENFDGFWRSQGNRVYEAADRQVNAIYRQPAVMITYFRIRKQYAGMERQYIEEHTKRILDSIDFKTAKSEEWAREQATALGQAHYAQIAADIAVNTVLKYADNPAIRSNFAMSARAVGRYFRSTEDFYRRMYRLAKERGPQTLYRMRLMQTGMQGSGVWHKDSNGNEYLILPTDAIINHAVEPVMRTMLNVNDHYKIPMFDEVTMKLNLLNPSFSADAGQPTFSGPAMALSMLGIRALANHSPFFRPEMQKITETVDLIALGPTGANLDLSHAIVPMGLQNIWNALSQSDKRREEATAQVQAISYMQAHGMGLKADASAKEINDYKKAVRVAAHNIIAIRSVLGLISPFMPTLQEGKDMPDYYKNAGLPSLRSAFFDLQNGIKKDLGNSVLDPYELATSTFIGKNPGKLVYTISRTDRNTKVILDKTNAMKNWVINNRGFVDKYGEAAYLFSPHTTDYNANIYTWMQAQDLLKIPTLETYLDRVMVAEDKAKYFAVARQETEALNNVGDIAARRQIIAEATYTRQSLLAGNPLLRKQIQNGAAIPEELTMLDRMKEMLDDAKTPISMDNRVKMKVLVQRMEEFKNFAEDPNNKTISNFTQIKADAKASLEALIASMDKDPVVYEANRAVFKGILDFYSRDSYQAG